MSVPNQPHRDVAFEIQKFHVPRKKSAKRKGESIPSGHTFTKTGGDHSAGQSPNGASSITFGSFSSHDPLDSAAANSNKKHKPDQKTPTGRAKAETERANSGGGDHTDSASAVSAATAVADKKEKMGSEYEEEMESLDSQGRNADEDMMDVDEDNGGGDEITQEAKDCFEKQKPTFKLSAPDAIDLWFDVELELADIAERKRKIKAIVLQFREEARQEKENSKMISKLSSHASGGGVNLGAIAIANSNAAAAVAAASSVSLGTMGGAMGAVSEAAIPMPSWSTSSPPQSQASISAKSMASARVGTLGAMGAVGAAAGSLGAEQEAKFGDARFNEPIDEQDLQFLIYGYDEQFFDEKLSDYLEHQKTEFHIRFSTPMDKLPKGWAGVCQMENDKITILLHPGFNSLTFKHGQVEEGCGVLCHDRLDCLMATLEHELVHMMMQVFYRAFKMAHGKPFQSLARGLFGHRLFTHAFGYGQGLDRIHRAHDKEIKSKKCNRRDMIAYLAGVEPIRVRFGMVLNKTQDHVTVMHSDGSILDRIPFWNLHILDPTQFDGSEGESNEEKRMGGMGTIASASTHKDSFDLFAPFNESKQSRPFVYEGRPPPASEWYAMLQWANRFLVNKTLCVANTTYVRYLSASTKSLEGENIPNLKGGLVTAKKACSASVVISENSSTCQVPYHCLFIDSNKEDEDVDLSGGDGDSVMK